MKIAVALSSELNENDWIEISDGFNQCFDAQKLPADLKKYYSTSTLGYCFHAIGRNDSNEIVAHTSIFPYKYIVGDKEYLFGLSGGSFVMKAFRKDAFLFVDLVDALKLRCLEAGVSVTYGVPNENSFQITLEFLGSTHLKDLPFFILPVSLSNLLLKKKLNFVDKITSLLAISWLGINSLISNIIDSIEHTKSVQLQLNDEVKHLRFGDKYKKVKQSECEGVYRVVEESGVKTAYLMDFRRNGQRSFRALVGLVQSILRYEKVDVLLFVGELSFFQMLLIKVPKRFEPQRLPITYDILDTTNSELVKLVSNPKNWDFSLINFDVR